MTINLGLLLGVSHRLTIEQLSYWHYKFHSKREMRLHQEDTAVQSATRIHGQEVRIRTIQNFLNPRRVTQRALF